MEHLVERFLSYVNFETTSDEESETCPSTAGQTELAKFLREELKRIGLQEISLDENGYLMATLPSNVDHPTKTIGFVAHMDTSPDMSGRDPKPRIVQNYDGKDIVLQDGIVLEVEKFPELINYKGQDLIVTDGTTLLGADDKAGIAEIVTALEYLIQNPQIPHGKIRICFTPDEEIGRGADRFDVEKFGADYAYTVDGGEIGELEYENFNAAGARLIVRGTSVHPGTAKDKMVNAMTLAMEFHHQLPAEEVPEHTEHYEGFYHLIGFKGAVEQAQADYIIRDFDKDSFEKRKQMMVQIAERLNQNYGEERFILAVKDQYYNMKEKIEENMFLIDIAIEAMKKANVTPKIVPIRGGTDGSRLSFMGLPTPNIFTGGHNYHGKFEYVPVQSMKKAVEVILNIAEAFGHSL